MRKVREYYCKIMKDDVFSLYSVLELLKYLCVLVFLRYIVFLWGKYYFLYILGEEIVDSRGEVICVIFYSLNDWRVDL